MDIKQIPGQNPQQQIDSGKTHNAANIADELQANKHQPDAVSTADDKVELSAQATKLQQTIASLDSISAVDTDKVANIKNAIEAGTFQVDSTRLSNKLVDFELSFPE